MNIWMALAINAVLVLVCWKKRWLSPSGCVAGFLIGFIISICLGLAGFVVLMVFFLGGQGATRFQIEKKRALGVAQQNQGKRSWKHAWANAGAGVGCAVISAWYLRQGVADWAEAWRWAFVACFAAALSDTLSSEFGQLSNQQPWLITSGKEVAVGTDGGLTRAGILMGILGATVLTLVGRFIEIVPVRATLPVVLAGLSGNLLDSWMGATLEKSGVLTNEGVNFSNTVAGAMLGLGGYWMMVGIPQFLRWIGWDSRSILDMFI